MNSRINERVMVALSGGVDSAVAATLLVDAGHEVEGVYVKTWEHETEVLGDCPGAQDLADAEKSPNAWEFPLKSLTSSISIKRTWSGPWWKVTEMALLPIRT